MQISKKIKIKKKVKGLLQQLGMKKGVQLQARREEEDFYKAGGNILEDAPPLDTFKARLDVVVGNLI